MPKSESERGQLLMLVVGFGLAILMLIVVVTNVSQVFLYRRALHSAADGAALAASDALDTGSVYEGGSDQIRLSWDLADKEIQDYASEAEYPKDFHCELADLNQSRVTAHCFGEATLPFIDDISGGKGKYPVTADASAQTFAN